VDPSCLFSLNGNVEVFYRKYSNGYLVNRSLSGTTWGEELVINPFVSSTPICIQKNNGEYFLAYHSYPEGYVVGRTLQRYAQLGAGVIEIGGSQDDGYYRKSSDGVLEQWGTAEITMSVGTVAYSFTPPVNFMTPPGVIPNMESPVVTALVHAGSHWDFILRGTQSDYDTIAIVLSNTGVSQTAWIKWHAIGRWR
jgi:hypothetical protein